MSLEQFQQAIADIVASPARCIELRLDPEILSAYDLTALERKRLIAIVWHKGMSHNCTLYRANRLTPIARSLPRTCQALGRELSAELDAYWEVTREFELQFKTEAERFAEFLLGRLRTGGLSAPGLDQIIQDELSKLDRRFAIALGH